MIQPKSKRSKPIFEFWPCCAVDEKARLPLTTVPRNHENRCALRSDAVPPAFDSRFAKALGRDELDAPRIAFLGGLHRDHERYLASSNAAASRKSPFSLRQHKYRLEPRDRRRLGRLEDGGGDTAIARRTRSSGFNARVVMPPACQAKHCLCRQSHSSAT